MCMVSRSARLKFVDIDIYKLKRQRLRHQEGSQLVIRPMIGISPIGYIVSHLDTLLFPEV